MVLAVQSLGEHVRKPGFIINGNKFDDQPRRLFPHFGRGHAIHTPVSSEGLIYTLVDKLSGQPSSRMSV